VLAEQVLEVAEVEAGVVGGPLNVGQAGVVRAASRAATPGVAFTPTM
jgi:hypothetical protein